MPAVGLGRGPFHWGGGTVSVFPLGDSYTVGLRGDTGGWRARLATTGWQGVGPHTDPTGRNHAGVGGETLNDMDSRVAAQLAAHAHQEIWLHGGTNDILGADSAATTEGDLTTLLATIYGTVPASRVTRIGTCPPTDSASDATIDPYNMRIAKVVAEQQALGRSVYMHDSGDFLVVGDLDATPVKHPVDGTYGIAGSGYGKWAAYWDRWFDSSLAKAPDAVTGTLEYWFDADDVTTSSGRVTQANDKSGNGRHAAESGGSGPTYTAIGTSFSGPCMTFNGTSNYLRTGTGFTVSQPSTMVVVCGPVSSAQRIVVDSANAAARNVLWSSHASDKRLSLFAGSTADDTLLLYSNQARMYLVEFNGASSVISINGNRRRSVALNPGAQGLQGVTLGASVAGSNFADVELYAAWGYSGLLSEADTFALAMYARNKWGLWPLLGG